MTILTLTEMREQLAFTPDLGDGDDRLIWQKVEAAQQHIERLLGFQIEAEYGGPDQEPVPPALKEAVCQLAAWWYEQREAGLVGESASLTPLSVAEIVREFRGFTF